MKNKPKTKYKNGVLIYKRKGKEWGWRLSINGRIVASSSEGFKRKSGLLKNIRSTVKNLEKFLKSTENKDKCKVILWMFE